MGFFGDVENKKRRFVMLLNLEERGRLGVVYLCVRAMFTWMREGIC